MLSLTIVFDRCGASLLRPLLTELVEDGGALGAPSVAERHSTTEVTAQFGSLAGMREVSRFVQTWSNTQPDIEYICVRET